MLALQFFGCLVFASIRRPSLVVYCLHQMILGEIVWSFYCVRCIRSRMYDHRGIIMSHNCFVKLIPLCSNIWILIIFHNKCSVKKCIYTNPRTFRSNYKFGYLDQLRNQLHNYMDILPVIFLVHVLVFLFLMQSSIVLISYNHGYIFYIWFSVKHI